MTFRLAHHLICEVPVTFSQAALGAEIDIPTLDGMVRRTLEPGIQSGEHLRLPGKGMPSLRSGRAGDLLVVIKVETPKHLTKRQEELLRELADKHRLLLILDEVQSSMGRTGRWFAHQHWDVAPDIMTLSKSLCGGVAGGALLARPEVAEKLRVETLVL